MSCFDQLKEFPLQQTLGQRNNVAVLGIIVHLIDDRWRIQEKVLGVEELVASHQGAILVEVLYRVLEVFDLTQKVSNFCLTMVHYQSSMHTFLKHFK